MTKPDVDPSPRPSPPSDASCEHKAVRGGEGDAHSQRATTAVPAVGRLLGLDYGTHRVGAAISTYEQNLASPLENYTLRSDRLDADWLAQLATDYRAVGLVVGLPLHMRSGDEGQKAHEARAFGEWASAVTGLPVTYHDERMTSASAEVLLMEAGFTKKQIKARIDKLAAQIMLQSYLDKRRSDAATGTP